MHRFCAKGLFCPTPQRCKFGPRGVIVRLLKVSERFHMANFTRKAIMDSFVKLAGAKPVNKITVRDIVEDCGISRNSFYYHFEDIPSLVNAIIVEKADRIISENAENASLGDCLEAVAKFVLDNKKAALNMYRSVSRDVFEHYLMNICRHVVRTYSSAVLDSDGSGFSQEDREIMLRYYSAELFGQVIDWLSHSLSYDVVEQFERFQELRPRARELFENKKDN